jgi:hypothetical protein
LKEVATANEEFRACLPRSPVPLAADKPREREIPAVPVNGRDSKSGPDIVYEAL